MHSEAADSGTLPYEAAKWDGGQKPLPHEKRRTRPWDCPRTSCAEAALIRLAETAGVGLSAQPAVHGVRKTARAYAALKKGLKSGKHEPSAAKRRARVENAPPRFREDAVKLLDGRSPSGRPDAPTACRNSPPAAGNQRGAFHRSCQAAPLSCAAWMLCRVLSGRPPPRTTRTLPASRSARTRS